MDGLSRILEGVQSLEQELAGRPDAVADRLRAIGTPCAGEYADCAVGKNGFGGDVAEIYFYRFAPEGSPRPGGDDYAAMRAGPSYPAYARQCYDGFLEEISKVERVLNGFPNILTINGLSVGEFKSQVEEAGVVPDHRVNIKVGAYDFRRKAILDEIKRLATLLSETGD